MRIVSQVTAKTLLGLYQAPAKYTKVTWDIGGSHVETTVLLLQNTPSYMLPHIVVLLAPLLIHLQRIPRWLLFACGTDAKILWPQLHMPAVELL